MDLKKNERVLCDSLTGDPQHHIFSKTARSQFPCEAKIINIDRKNRVISLSAKAKEEHEEKEALSSYQNESSSSSGATTLGELLKEKMTEK